jgi:HAD superfamily hydrolase (TIGR01549 family)
VDTVYKHVIAWSTTLASAGFSVPKWKLHRRICMSGKAMLRQVLREPGQKSRRPNIEKLEKEHDANFQRASRNLILLPGAIDLLRFLDRHKVRWAIATTGNLAQTKRMLQNLTLPEPAVVVTGDDVRKAKPSLDIFVLAAEKLGLAIADCIVVGDSVGDMLAAGRRGALGSANRHEGQATRHNYAAFLVFLTLAPACFLSIADPLALGCTRGASLATETLTSSTGRTFCHLSISGLISAFNSDKSTGTLRAVV